MEKSYFLSTTFNNIVFKGRNKAYGAYTLRRSYSKHMFLAATIATALFSGALVGPLVDAMFFADPVKYEEPVYHIIRPVDIPLPPPPKKPEPEKAVTPPPAPAKEKVATEKFDTPKVVDDATPENGTVPDQEYLSKVNIGTEKIEGNLPDVPSVTLIEEPPVGLERGTGKEASESEPFVHVDQMPQFKGGAEALMAYLGRKIRYPAAAQNNGIEGTVVVTFVVGTTGEITDIEILKGLGFGTEEEATRVIKSMPKWEPGRQNGRAVPVRYTLPIRFRIQ